MSTTPVNKTQAMVTYLLTCPSLANQVAYFNFSKAKDKNKQIITNTNDTTLDKRYVDGSELKRFTITLVDYRSIAYNPIVNISGASNENVADYIDVQAIVDWVEIQDSLRNYPNFGTDCAVDKIEALSVTPSLDSVDTTISPALAKYSVTIRVTYLDMSKKLWK